MLSITFLQRNPPVAELVINKPNVLSDFRPHQVTQKVNSLQEQCFLAKRDFQILCLFSGFACGTRSAKDLGLCLSILINLSNKASLLGE